MKYYRLEPSVKKSVVEWHSFKRKDEMHCHPEITPCDKYGNT